MQERNVFPNNSINSIARNSINIHEIMIQRKDLHNRKHLAVIALDILYTVIHNSVFNSLYAFCIRNYQLYLKWSLTNHVFTPVQLICCSNNHFLLQINERNFVFSLAPSFHRI